MKKSIIILISIIQPVFAQDVLLLKDALQLALQNNYSIQVTKNDASIATNNNRPGAAGMLPVVTGSINQDNQVIDTKQKFLSGAENNKSGAKSSQLGVNIELGWTIFDGFKMFAAKNRLQELQQVGELRMRSNIEQTFVRVTRAYCDVMLVSQQLKAAQELVENSQHRFNLSVEKYKAGKSAKTEQLKAQVDLNTDKSTLLKLEQTVMNAKVNMNQLLARDLATPFNVPDSFAGFVAYKLDDVLSKSNAQNVGVLMAKRNQRISQLSLAEIRAERMPQIQLKSGYNFSRQESQAGFLQSAQNTGFHYGAGLSINLFNGFDVNRRLQNANLTIRSNEAIYRDSMSRVQQAVMVAFNNYNTGKILVGLETENTDVADQNYMIADEQYKQGVITALELRDAQQNLMNAKLRLFSAQYETRLAETELMRLTGELFKP